MKGGRTAPRNRVPLLLSSSSVQAFNEGGADCPPKRKGLVVEPEGTPPSMKGGRTAPRNYLPRLKVCLSTSALQ